MSQTAIASTPGSAPGDHLPAQTPAEVELEHAMILIGSLAWFLGVAYLEYSRPAESGDLRGILRLIGMLAAGPVTLRFLFGRELNKLIVIIVVFLALGGSSIGMLKSAGLSLRWVAMGVAAAIGYHCWLRRPAMVATFTHVVIFAWAVMAMASSTYAVTHREFAFNKSVSVFLLFGATLLYCYERFDTPARMASALATLAKVSAAFFAANFLFLFSNTGYLGGRYRGITENPNTLGGFFTVVMAPVVYLFFAKWRQRGKLTHPEVLTYLGLTVGSTFLLFRSGSRAGLLGAFVGGAIYMFVAERQYFVKVGAIMIPAIMTALFFMPEEQLVVEERTQDALLESAAYEHLFESTASGRTEAWTLAAKLIEENPLLGKGWGTTRYIFREYIERDYFKRHHGAHVHNSFLELALELGIPLAVAFCLALLFLIAGAMRKLGYVRDPEERALIGGLLGALCGGIVGAVWESWLIAAGSFGAFNFWLVVAVLLRLNRSQASEWKS